MKRFLKIILGALAALVLLLIAATFALPLIFDTDDLKQRVVAAIKDQTGRDMKIDGDLEFSVFPNLSVEVNDLSLSNPESFAGGEFSRVERASVQVALMPLFRKELEIGEVQLSGMELDLIVTPEGLSNWADLLSNEGNTAASSDEAGMDQAPGSPFESQKIAGLSISDANLELNDQQAGLHYRLSNVNVTTGELGPGLAIPVSASATIEDLVADTKTEVSVSTTVKPDSSGQVFSLTNLDFEALLPGALLVEMKAPDAQLDLTAQTLEVGAFNGSLAGIELSGDISANQIVDQPSASGSLQLEPFSPRQLMDSLGAEPVLTTDPGVLEEVRLETRYEASLEGLSLQDLRMNLDDSLMTGRVDIRNPESPSLEFDLEIDTINIDRYLPPESPEVSEGAPEPLPTEEIKGQNVRGTLVISQLTMMDMQLSDATLGVNAADGVLQLNPLTANFYGGRYSGNIQLDTTGPAPVLSLDEHVESILLQELVGDLLGSANVSGEALGRLKAQGTGDTVDEIISSLSGGLQMDLAEGALEGINVWDEIRSAVALFKGVAAPARGENRTVFSKLVLNADIADGVMNLQELTGQLPFLDLNGTGSINLAEMALDLGMVAAVRDVPELKQDPLASDLAGREVPFRLGGTFDAPSVGIDAQALLKSEAASRLLDKLGLDSDSAKAVEGENFEDTARSVLGGFLKKKLEPEPEPEEKDGDGNGGN